LLSSPPLPANQSTPGSVLLVVLQAVQRVDPQAVVALQVDRARRPQALRPSEVLVAQVVLERGARRQVAARVVAVGGSVDVVVVVVVVVMVMVVVVVVVVRDKKRVRGDHRQHHGA
jgi:hypothetical protein